MVVTLPPMSMCTRFEADDKSEYITLDGCDAFTFSAIIDSVVCLPVEVEAGLCTITFAFMTV